VLKRIQNFQMIVLLLLLLPSCGKLIDWGKERYNTVSYINYDRTLAQKYLRSIITYDQLTTEAYFDALWLSDEVRAAYVDLFVLKFGKTEEQQKIFLRRQYEENNHFISFYVLSLYENPLGEPLSEWTPFLRIDEVNYQPIEIKVVDLSPEYIYLFGKKYNRFKVAYSVKFDAKDIEDEFLITPDTQKIDLYFRSAQKEAILSWDVSVQSTQADTEVNV
jgi:hypothetical protein